MITDAMPKAALATLVNHCDRLLRTREIGDYDGAVNSLQVGNRGTVTRLAATDTQIDRLVYDLYGLTEDEINIVEGKAP